MTLAFLGAQPKERLDALLTMASGIEGTAFDLRLDRLTTIGKGFICLQPSTTPQALSRLVATLAEHLAALGVVLDSRPFLPHLTLVRQAIDRAAPRRASPGTPTTSASICRRQRRAACATRAGTLAAGSDRHMRSARHFDESGTADRAAPPPGSCNPWPWRPRECRAPTANSPSPLPATAQVAWSPGFPAWRWRCMGSARHADQARFGSAWLTGRTPFRLETTCVEVHQQHGDGQAGKGQQQSAGRAEALQQIDLRIGAAPATCRAGPSTPPPACRR